MRTTDQTLTRGPITKTVEVVSVEGNLALVRDANGTKHTIRTDIQRAKGELPQPGEVWIVGHDLGFLTFAAVVGFTGIGARRKSVYTTRELTVSQTEVGVIPLSLGYRILHIATTAPSRTRLYDTAADRDFDLVRPVSIIPAPSVGIVMDFLTVPQMLAAPLSPVPEGVNLESTPSALIPISVTSVNGGTITVTLTWVRTE